MVTAWPPDPIPRRSVLLRIVGLGVDIVEIARIERAILRVPGLVERVFTRGEISYCRSKPGSQYAHFAGRFAAKEAVAKAIGRSLGWREVAVENDPLGKPATVLTGRAAEAARGGKVLLSISHSRDYAVAHAVFMANDQGGPYEHVHW